MPLSSIDRRIAADDLTKALQSDVREGLTSTPKALPPKWFYDARGSELFERITALEEYYPTRAERAVLAEHAGAVAAASGAGTLVELGSGSSEKTRLLLDALAAAGTLRRYVPVDVSESALAEAAGRIAEGYPGVDVHGLVDDFEHTVRSLPPRRPDDRGRLVAVLGGTIGNLRPEQRRSFLADLSGALSAGDTVLLGTDLVKSRDRLVAAYDDAAGVTAEFNRNVLRVINRELGADFPLEDFEHVVLWDAENEWIEMRLRARRELTVRVPALELDVSFAEGEEMRTETSAKFRQEVLEAELAVAGLELRHWWTDPNGDFALSLSVPHPEAAS